MKNEVEPTILEKANDIIFGERNKAYGHPQDNFQRIADLWHAFLQGKYGACHRLSPEDVAVLNILQKVARLEHTPGHQDSLIDIAGYAGTIERLKERRG